MAAAATRARLRLSDGDVVVDVAAPELSVVDKAVLPSRSAQLGGVILH
jgi:hypothetical protein